MRFLKLPSREELIAKSFGENMGPVWFSPSINKAILLLSFKLLLGACLLSLLSIIADQIFPELWIDLVAPPFFLHKFNADYAYIASELGIDPAKRFVIFYQSFLFLTAIPFFMLAFAITQFPKNGLSWLGVTYIVLFVFLAAFLIYYVIIWPTPFRGLHQGISLPSRNEPSLGFFAYLWVIYFVITLWLIVSFSFFQCLAWLQYLLRKMSSVPRKVN